MGRCTGAALVLAAAAWASSVTAGSGLSRAAPVRFGGTFDIIQMGAYVGWRGGFLEQRGVSVREFVFTQGGAAALQALLAGELDVYSGALPLLLRARTQGRQVRIIAPLAPEQWALTVRTDLQDRIRSVRDLQGRAVGVSSIGSGSWAFLTRLVAVHGMDPQRDVRILPLGGEANIISALRAARVDAAVTWQPGTTVAVREGIGFPLINLLEPQQHQQVMNAPVSLSLVLAVRGEMAQQNPEGVRAIVAAMDDAYAWIHRHTAREIASLMRPLAASVEPDVLEAAVQQAVQVVPRSAVLSRSAYGVSMSLLSDTGIVDRPVAFDEVVDCALARCGP